MIEAQVQKLFSEKESRISTLVINDSSPVIKRELDIVNRDESKPLSFMVYVYNPVEKVHKSNIYMNGIVGPRSETTLRVKIPVGCTLYVVRGKENSYISMYAL